MGNISFSTIVILLVAGLVWTNAHSEHSDTDAVVSRVKRVIGGVDITKGQWPYLAHLKGKVPRGVWLFGGYTFYYCGASVINKRWVLTAAHCVRPEHASWAASKAKHWHIKAGEVKKSHNVWDSVVNIWGKLTKQDDLLLWYLHASKIVVHPQYKAGAANLWLNDIALIKLEKDLPVESDSDIGIIPLPEDNGEDWPAAGTECVMKGWGCTVEGGDVSETAKAQILPIIDTKRECSAYYGEVGSTRLCAGYNLQDKGICSGDSGGPLVCKKGNTWYQAGIASFSRKGRTGQVPGVFTRVSSYRNWIDEVIRTN